MLKRRTRAILAGMALACVLAAFVGGWLLLAPGTQLPGSPLPRLTLDAAAVPDAVLRIDREGMDARPGPAEGSLSRGLPSWQVSVMRESGLALIDVPVVLTWKVLNGTVPEPDDVGALLAAMLGALKPELRCRRYRLPPRISPCGDRGA